MKSLSLAVLTLVLGAACLLAGCPASPSADGGGVSQDPAEAKAVTPPAGAQIGGAAKPPPPACASCHEVQHRFWAYGKHSTLACTDCHGEPGDHLVEKIDPRPEMKNPDRESCLECHDLVEDTLGKKLTAEERLEKHLAFLDKKHVIKIDREKIKGRCLHCHDPHMGR